MNYINNTEQGQEEQKSSMNHISGEAVSKQAAPPAMSDTAMTLNELLNEESSGAVEQSEASKEKSSGQVNYSEAPKDEPFGEAQASEPLNVENEQQPKELDLPEVATTVQPKIDQDSNQATQDKDFGKVQLSDEKELKKNEQKRTKEQIEKDNIKVKNILISSCELALSEVFSSKKQLEVKDFQTLNVNCLIIEVGSYKGFLLLGNSSKQEFAKEDLEQFRQIIFENLQNNKLFGEISSDFSIKAEIDNYIEVIDEFADFSIKFADDTGKQQVTSFVKREVVRPVLSDSEKENMFLVDIKAIPPQTPVNFDAFLFLPRNKRFVRYLKSGRSLSLKQAKRHTEEEDGQSKLYLPKEHKRNFVQYYIQNTLNWEFMLHSKNKKKIA